MSIAASERQPAPVSGNPPSDPRAEFPGILRDNVTQNTLVKLILSRYDGNEADLKRITIRPVQIKGQWHLCFVYHYKTRDITKNHSTESGMETIAHLLGREFKTAHLFSLTGNAQLEFKKNGECRLTHSPPTHHQVESAEHNREKHRHLDPRRPFLQALGITDRDHRVLPSMSHKWKQIDKFLEIFAHALTSSGLANAKQIRVVDFGSGKGYLTFAVHDYLYNALGIDAQVTGVEVRTDLVRFCADVAAKTNSKGLVFQRGDIENYKPGTLDVLIALHACDMATDLAMALGIRTGAKIILCAPCCHKQIRPQLRPPKVLQPLLRFGVHLAQEAEMVTDGLRALLLEAAGYEVTLSEFVSLEHTDKNKMIMGIKRSSPGATGETWSRIQAIKEFYGIREHRLESLVRSML